MVNSLPITMATAAAPLISAGFSDIVRHARVSFSWGVVLLNQAKLILRGWRRDWRRREVGVIWEERHVNNQKCPPWDSERSIEW